MSTGKDAGHQCHQRSGKLELEPERNITLYFPGRNDKGSLHEDRETEPCSCWGRKWCFLHGNQVLKPLDRVTTWSGLPRGFRGEESTCQCRTRGLDHWVGKVPRRRKWKETHSSVLARSMPWTEEPGGLQSTGLQRVRHD